MEEAFVSLISTFLLDGNENTHPAPIPNQSIPDQVEEHDHDHDFDCK